MAVVRWLGLGLVVVLLGIGVYAAWPRRAGEVTYGWMKRPGVVVDLYAPPASRAPLVVFFQGNEPSEPDERQAFAAAVSDALGRKGIATAAVSFGGRATARDLAGLVRDATRARAPKRLVLAGRGLGATMASLLALDPRLLEGTHVDGVIGVRGTYEALSPRADAPPFLLLSAGDDDASSARAARTFARALRSAGARHVDDFVVPARDAHSIVHWGGPGNELGDLVTGFVSAGPKELPIDDPFGVLRRWGARPPLDDAELRKDPAAIVTYPVDDTFRDALMHLFGRTPYALSPLPGKTYQAIDLLDYLAKRPEAEVGKGKWLVVTNLRGEAQYFSREALEKTRPVIVVGIDDEDNLYRLVTFYRLKRAYSWIKGEEPMPTMIRPLGAFLHFRTPPPKELRDDTYAPFGLDETSFRWVEEDPLAPARPLGGELREAMIGAQGCLKCHALRGAGARAHHALADSGKPYGAFALPLEEYPPDVLRRFLFEQDKVARSFGVVPLPVEEKTARELFDLVRR